jgi:hypothetical protein
MTEPSEETLIIAMTQEIARKEAMEITFQPFSVYQLTGLVQLALRHPDVPAHTRKVAAQFLAGVRAYFADCPTVLEVIRRGDDPAEDRPREEHVIGFVPATALLEALRQEHADALRPADRDFLRAIENERDPDALVVLLHRYYGDGERADRTPRSFLYLHLGMLVGARE